MDNQEHLIENLFLCATNEGELYPRWCSMGRDAHASRGEWELAMRVYARRLVREDRAEVETLMGDVIDAAAARVRAYYVEHVAEVARVEAGQ